MINSDWKWFRFVFETKKGIIMLKMEVSRDSMTS